MAAVANPTISSVYKRIGAGDIYLAAYPTTMVATTLTTILDTYYAIFYDDGVAKKAIKSGTKRLCETTSAGLSLKIKSGSVEFEPNNSPKQKLGTGVEDATGEFSFYDADPAHLAFLFGVDSTQLLDIAPGTGKAGRMIAAMAAGVANSNSCFTVMFRMPSVLIPSEYDHVLIPCCRINPELDLKLSRKDKVEAKATLSIVPDTYALGADGTGICFVVDAADTVATA
jgi:hypothetical protein